MFNIFADSMFTATRTKQWDSPDHWRKRPTRPFGSSQARATRQRELKRWMDETGFR